MRETIFISSLILLLNSSCKKDETDPKSGTVKYEVTCNPAGFDITYENSSGNTEQKTLSSSTTWTTSFTGKKGNFVYISAQANSYSATISAKIYYQGKVIEQSNSSGDFVIATASGSIP